MDNLRSFPFVWVFVDINYPLSIDLGVTHHSSVDKESVCNAGDPGLIPGWERFPGKGIGYPFKYSWCFLVAQLVKKSICNSANLASTPGLGRSSGEGKGYPLLYSCLENSMDCIVHGVTKLDTTEQLSLMTFDMLCFHFHSTQSVFKFLSFLL